MPSSADSAALGPAEPPLFGEAQDYGRSLADAQFWLPWAQRALALSGLDARPLRVGFTGTYPVLLDDQAAIKLFGHFGDWRGAHRVESAALAAVGRIDGLRVPELLGHGALFPGREDSWPYLVMSVVPGRAWREFGLEPGQPDSGQDGAELATLAGQIGEQIGRLHRAPQPPGLPRAPQRSPHQVAARHRAWGTLPDALVDQIPDFVARFGPADPVLIHGDLTQDHLLVEHGRLSGIIDFGDAQWADPFLELGALQLGAFAGRVDLLDHFLAGYGWTRSPDFAERALAAALSHEFDLFEQLAPPAVGEGLSELALRWFGR